MKRFQYDVGKWMNACFSDDVCLDVRERCHRLVEEALELAQSLGMPDSDAHQLVGYVYGRPAGEPKQEVGGVIVTLAALCEATRISLDDAAADELLRIWDKIGEIRQKQAAKPKHSPLPEWP